MKSIHIFATFSHALEVFTANWRQYLGLLITVMVVAGFLGIASTTTTDYGYSVTSPVIALGAIIATMILQIGLIESSLALVRGKKVEFTDLYKNITLKKGLLYFVSSFIMAMVTVLGFILLIIPGVYLAIALMFTKYVAVDQQLGPIESVFASNKMVWGNWWKMFALVLILIVLNILGFFAFIIGLLLTIPVSMLVIADAYNQLESKNFRRALKA